MSDSGPITLDQHGCARCGGDGHPNMTFLPLTHPVEINAETIFTHWALCPTNGEPILMLTFNKEPVAWMQALTPLAEASDTVDG